MNNSSKVPISSLDYIAFLAIATATLTAQYLVAGVIIVMLLGGNALESYATARAKKSLTKLINRIPSKTLIWHRDDTVTEIDVAKVEVGQKIIVRGNEVVPLDGNIVNGSALIDESSLTGEPYAVEKSIGDTVRSGTVNIGEKIIVEVTKNTRESTYTKIIDLVRRANAQKAPIVRLANRYSVVFTALTFMMCAVAYLISRDIYRVLAVLVVATPCPLILATPIALFGGMNKSASKNILIKNPASLEKLRTVTDVVFDKTGTITIGKPSIEKVEIVDKKYSLDQVYGVAEALERNSLHPFAKTIVAEANKIRAPRITALDVREQIGIGVFGTINDTTYALTKAEENKHSISLLENSKIVAHFIFEDKVKENFSSTLSTLRSLGLALHIFTGDKKENAGKIVQLAAGSESFISITANMTPEDKEIGVSTLKSKGKKVVMIGDGINDAPALAASDVGIVFSNEEQTASSEAADIVLLSGGLDTVVTSISIANRTIEIALQSIFIGIGLSVIAMILASLGIIKPLTGAILQEVIDVLVILNALRASL